MLALALVGGAQSHLDCDFLSFFVSLHLKACVSETHFPGVRQERSRFEKPPEKRPTSVLAAREEDGDR